jgi:hypothetical protein
MMLRSSVPPPESSLVYRTRPAVMLKYAPWSLAYAWGYDEIVMRAGPPHFTAGVDEVLRLAQYPVRRMSYVPASEIFFDHLNATPAHWTPTKPRAFEFMSGDVTEIRGVPFQLAWFRRGDTGRVVVASDVSRDSLLSRARTEPLIFFQNDYDKPLLRFTGSAGPVHRYFFAAPRDSTLASIELVPRSGPAGRARFATGPQHHPATRFTLSDLLLTEVRDTLPRTLEEAARVARGSTTFVEAGATGIFWEVYGLAPGDSAAIAITVSQIRDSGGLLGAVFGRSAPDSMTVKLETARSTGNPVEAHVFNLAFGTLRPGRYMITVSFVTGMETAVSRREIEIVRGVRR